MFWYVWLLIFLVCLVVEIVTMTLFFICFAFGGLIAMLGTLCGLNVTWSIAVFLIISLISMLFIRPFIKKYIDKKKTETNVDSLLGKQAIVIKEITANSTGQVKVDGEIWLAVSNKEFKINDIVTVVNIDGTKLIVK